MMDSSAEPLAEYRGRTRSPRRQKTAVAVAQRIVEEISRHQYPPGTKLPAEREMLAQYEVGRGTLRESLRFLEMNGVLTVKPGPGGGPIVSAPNAHDLASTLGLFLELHGTRFGAILDVREVLEPALAGMAASRRDESVIGRIGASVDLMAAHLDNLDLFLEENERFHELVAAAAGNPVFTLLTGSLDRITDGSRLGIDYPVRRRQAVLTAHQAIYQALATGDADAARQEMERHMRAFRRYTDKYYPQAAGSVLRWSDIAP
jgi:GntR family transcriptional regulator, transcriptional repressor for pyruvate dehydrogenase complex